MVVVVGRSWLNQTYLRRALNCNSSTTNQASLTTANVYKLKLTSDTAPQMKDLRDQHQTLTSANKHSGQQLRTGGEIKPDIYSVLLSIQLLAEGTLLTTLNKNCTAAHIRRVQPIPHHSAFDWHLLSSSRLSVWGKSI